MSPEVWRENAWWRVEPNPPWEEIEISFSVAAGHYAFVDRLHIATECVNNPAIPAVSEWGLLVMALLGLAAGTIMFRRARAVAA